MAIIVVSPFLMKELKKKFKLEAVIILRMFRELEKNPKKGKLLGVVKNIAIKELKYKKFRFYFIADNYKIKFLDVSELDDLIIKFIRMSDKKSQEKVINEIKEVLKKVSG